MHVEDSDRVRTMTFDRPESRNAFTPEVAADLATAIEGTAADTHDAAVITGEGEAFCAGGDVESMVDREESARESYERLELSVGRVVEAVLTADVPIIAKVNGDAVGAGLSLAAISDFAFADATATFGCAFVHVGLVPDTGGTFLLPSLIGIREAKRLAFTGEFVDAAEAAELGLINQSVPKDELTNTVEDLLETLSSRPTETIGLTKAGFHENLGRGWRDALDHEMHLQTIAYGTHAHQEGTRAFLEDRDPEW